MIISNSELIGLNEAEIHYRLCIANLDGAKQLCLDILDKKYSSSFSHATVIMSLFHHGVELFLKYAISRSGKDIPHYHYIRGLLSQYYRIYSDEIFELQLPFITEFPGVSPDEVKELLEEERKDKNQTDQMVRYHMDRDGKCWAGDQAFSPETLPAQIEDLTCRFVAIRQEIEKVNGQQCAAPDAAEPRR